MVHYSVVIPARNAGDQIREQLPELCEVFKLLALPYEIICVDDASAAPSLRTLEVLLDDYPELRVLRLDHAVGISAALSAGLVAARGDIVIVMAPGLEYRADQIPHLIARLSRGDLIFGRRPTTFWQKAWRRLTRVPRWALLGLEVRDPDCLFWAARREAVENLELTRGQFRYVPSLLAMRGYRVSEMAIDCDSACRPVSDAWPNPLDLLSVWWLKHRYQAFGVTELAPERSSQPHVRVVDFDSPPGSEQTRRSA